MANMRKAINKTVVETNQSEATWWKKWHSLRRTGGGATSTNVQWI